MLKANIRGKIADGWRSERGSVTLESAILIPIIIFLVCMSVYILLILFEEAQFQSSSDYAAQRAASVWRGDIIRDSGAAGSGGDTKSSAATVGLYHRMYDPLTDKKTNAAADIAQKRMNGVSLPGYSDAGGDAKYRNGIMGKTLTVGLHGAATVPSLRITRTFGYSNIFDEACDATSLMPDFAENIRCVGYVLDIEKKLEEASPEFAEAVNNFTDIIGHIRGYLGEFAK